MTSRKSRSTPATLPATDQVSPASGAETQSAATPANTNGTTPKLTTGIATRLAAKPTRLKAWNHTALTGSSTSVTAAWAISSDRHQPPRPRRGTNIHSKAATAMNENQNPAPSAAKGSTSSTAARASSQARAG